MSESFRNLIASKIRENRPKLSDSSLRTYVSLLFNLHKKLTTTPPTIDPNSLDWFNNEQVAIIESLKDTTPKSRKSVLSALFVLTNNQTYREKMIEDCQTVNNAYKEQKKDTKEKANWLDYSNIKTTYDKLYIKTKAMFKKTMVGDSKTVINYLLIALMGGVLKGLPPRRSLDYALMKVRNYNPQTDNYYKAGKMYFNTYKTANKYGKQEAVVPDELNVIIKKWLKVNEGDYLLFSSNGQALTSSQISRMLNKIFDGKKISVDMLRHIYLTDLYKHMPSLLDMEKTAEAMGHSVGTAMTYIKKD